MTQKRVRTYLVLGLFVLAAGGFLAGRSLFADETTVAALSAETHFHGIAVDGRDGDRLYLATHHGLFVVDPDGTARRISETRDDFMGFTPHPADPAVLYASGHPASGGNLGFMVSRDGGASWSKLADGIGGPVDFHQMDVSKAEPEVIYGVHGGLQKSVDGGSTWSRTGAAPEGLIDLAASARDADTLYAATPQGLLVSTDGGAVWQPAHETRQPATMVQVSADGMVYAFIVGTGLVRAGEGKLDWEILNNDLGGSVMLHLAVAPGRGEPRMYAVAFDTGTRAQSLLVSRDGGRSWMPFGAS